jgi:hypothetical protein
MAGNRPAEGVVGLALRISGRGLLNNADAFFGGNSAERLRGSSPWLGFWPEWRRLAVSLREPRFPPPCSSSSGIDPYAAVSLSLLEVRDALDDLLAPLPVFRNDESLVGISRGFARLSAGVSDPRVWSSPWPMAKYPVGSSLMIDSAASGSSRGVVGPLTALSLFEFPPTAPVLARFFSASFSRSLSLLLMYIRPRWFRPVAFLPQLSKECCFLRLVPSARGESGSWLLRSMLSLPMLSAPDVSDPLLEGRETPPLLRRDRSPLRPVDESRAPGLLGDLGDVIGDKPLGGLEVRTTGALAGRSSRGTSPSGNSFSDGRAYAP